MDNIETTRNYDAIRDMYNILNALKEYDAKMYVTNHNLAGPPEFCAEILIEEFYRIEIEFYGNNRYMFYLRHPCYRQSDVDSSLEVAEELKKFIKSCKAAWYNELYKEINDSILSVSKQSAKKMLNFYIKELHDATSRSIDDTDELDDNIKLIYIKLIYNFAERIVRINDYLRRYKSKEMK